MVRFLDRHDAGRLLGQELARTPLPAPVILGLPRGGVPVAAEVAVRLDAPLDVLVVRKLGLPEHPELAMGAVGEGGVTVLNPDVVRSSGVSRERLEEVARRERAEVESRSERFRRGRPGLELAGRTAVIVDDGAATGATARAACLIARAQGAEHVVLAVPVAPPRLVDSLAAAGDADEVVCLHAPRDFGAVGAFYEDFSQTSDAEVVRILGAAG
ncbi:phosphoribosyltransferase [Rothia halotolerans]|uniref:phosphoribosyltransferase n=1 Tax=Rothia halotolerans TaxID=405770 RepID=UPI00101D0D31|nr:phosphoribosyltransferase family protein [Rothia halotolerans]